MLARCATSVKTPWRNGTTHVVHEPLDFLAKLVALVPRPRVNLTRSTVCLHTVVEGIKVPSLLENLTRQMFLGSDRFVEKMQTCIDKAQDREGWWIDAIR